MSRLGIIEIGGEAFDLDDLTLDEIEKVEELAGAESFGEINYASAKGLKAFTFVLMARSDPNLTMEQVGSVKVAAFIQPEEKMPALPPDGRGGPESQPESPPEDDGPQPSAASTTG